MVTKPAGVFPYGAQYYRAPNPPREERGRDIERMAELGFTIVKIQAHWNWINPRPGVHDISEILEMLDLAKARGIGVVLMINLENAPWWMFQRHPEARYQTIRGEVFDPQAVGGTPAGGWPGLCFDNEPVRRAAEETIAFLVKGCKDHPALAYWHAWEEPHMQPTSNLATSGHLCDSLLCCCKASLKTFRQWLSRRYGDLAEVNKAWHTRYSDLQEIRPPQRQGCYPLLMDWQRLQQENLARIMAWRVASIRKSDPHHSVISHLGANSVTSDDPFSPYMDDWLTAKHVDVWGASAFPAWAKGTDGEEFMSVQLTAAASAAGKKPFWSGELQADGACTAESIFIHTRPGTERFVAWNWLALGHGVKGIVLWQYRPEMLGPESPGFGLCGLDGSLTPRAEAAGRICRLINSTPVLMDGRPPAPEVGIIHSKDCSNLMRSATSNGEPLYSSMRGIHRALSRANVPFRFVHIDQDGLEVMRGMSVLYFPLPLCMSSAQAQALKEFVRQGGVLVSEAHAAHYDQHGFTSERVPGMGLDELFGCRRLEESTARIESERIDTERGELEGGWVKEAYEPTTGAVIGRYGDGTAAVVHNTYGKGQAILFGSVVFHARTNARIIRGFIPERCLGPVRTEPEAFARMLSTETDAAVIVVNQGSKRLEVNVEAGPDEGSRALIVPDRVPDLWMKTSWPARKGRISVSLEAWGVSVLSFRRNQPNSGASRGRG